MKKHLALIFCSLLLSGCKIETTTSYEQENIRNKCFSDMLSVSVFFYGHIESGIFSITEKEPYNINIFLTCKQAAFVKINGMAILDEEKQNKVDIGGKLGPIYYSKDNKSVEQKNDLELTFTGKYDYYNLNFYDLTFMEKKIFLMLDINYNDGSQELQETVFIPLKRKTKRSVFIKSV